LLEWQAPESVLQFDKAFDILVQLKADI